MCGCRRPQNDRVRGRTRSLPAAALLVVALVAGGLEAVPDREGWEAAFVGGERLRGESLGGWHDTRAAPRLGARKLFTPTSPIRWLRAAGGERPAEPAAFVEFMGGDRLPGRVIEFRPAPPDIEVHVVSSAEDAVFEPEHLLVEPAMPVSWRGRGSEVCAVRTSALRRVVWQRSEEFTTYTPGTVYLVDGSRVVYRSMRWDRGSLRLLGDDGVSELSFSDIAELHLPWRDPWEAYLETAAALSPYADTRLERVSTRDGLILTSSRERFRALHDGDQNDPGRWCHVFQPAWSLRPLWIEFERIGVRAYFEPHEVPLTWIEPATVRRRPILGGGWRCRIDENVQGGALASGGRRFAWGFGAQAFTELHFDVPDFARAFESRVGLDAVVGRGGCARALVSVPGREAALYRSPLLIGSSDCLDIGRVALPGDAGGLVLTADSAHDDRPRGADPFDIRDAVDWLEPIVHLHRRALRHELVRRARRHIPAWEGWKIDGGMDAPVRLVNAWDESDWREPRFVHGVEARPPFVRLSRRFTVPPDAKELVVGAWRVHPHNGTPRVEVRIDGESAKRFTIPHGRAKQPQRTLVSIAEHRGREVTVEVTQRVDTSGAVVRWAGLGLSRATRER